MKTVLNDLELHNLTLTEAVSMARNRALWKLLSASGSTHSKARFPLPEVTARVNGPS